MSLTVERSFHLGCKPGRRAGYRRAVMAGPEQQFAPSAGASLIERTPRIAKLMALAVYCSSLIRDGAVPDVTTMAQIAHVTQPRMTQILNLTLLAPDIQETLLCLAAVDQGKSKICEKTLRRLCSIACWTRQRSAYNFWRLDSKTEPASHAGTLTCTAEAEVPVMTRMKM